MGSFREGIASGHCWLAREGQGWLHGVVDARGRFTGNDIMFVYPDLTTCIVGSFDNERLVSGKASRVASVSFNENEVLVLNPAPPERGSPDLDFCPSNKTTIPCQWMLKDTFETTTVFCRTSDIDGAGDGLFAAKDLPANLIISYYNGLHIEPGEPYNTNSFSYQVKQTGSESFISTY